MVLSLIGWQEREKTSVGELSCEHHERFWDIFAIRKSIVRVPGLVAKLVGIHVRRAARSR
jgi:hypothetical protein